jgi:3-hydroxybutyryl-CoA dehydrogenase
MSIPVVEIVGIVGAGFMGSGIAEAVVLSGLPAFMYEPEGAVLDRSHEQIAASLDRAVARDKLTPDAAADGLARATFTTDLSDLLDCDLVIEAVTEDEPIKTDLFRRLDATLPQATILASNTSSIPIANLAAATSRSDRVVGIHFFSPVPVMKLCEIVPALTTRADVVASAEAFVRRIGKQPIRCKDRAGFLVNILLIPYLLSAVRLYEQGIASRDDIDGAMILGCGHPMGPLALCDLIGLDIIDGICASLYAEHKLTEYAAPPLLRRMVACGHLGRKTGQGFYDYAGVPSHSATAR